MRAIIRKITLAALVSGGTLLVNPCFGQSESASGYSHALGFRFGSDLGITYKGSIGGSSYIEGILSTGYRRLMLTALYEKHFPAFHRNDFQWYLGGGGHVGFFNGWYRTGYYDRWGRYHREYVYVNSEPTIGVDGIIGLEYNFHEIPLNVSVDIKPFINFYRYDYGFVEGALSLRYIF